MTRWLITGAGGMLGTELTRVLQGHDVLGLTRSELDITDAAATRDTVHAYRPDVVVNAAAWTAVDLAEEREADAFAVNAVGAHHVALACARVGAQLVHISTDYVFDGSAVTPYSEIATPCPMSAYGRTKTAGEWAVLSVLPNRSWVVRTAWLYGTHGSNFLKTMERLERERDTIDVVADQRGQPTWTRDLAQAIVTLVTAPTPPGIYHATSEGDASWFEFAQAIFSALGADPIRVRPTTTDQVPRPATRPAYSVLGHAAFARVGLSPLPHWKESLIRAVALLPSDSQYD
jgi:dTDP-4-dehydrorhamnose reductase